VIQKLKDLLPSLGEDYPGINLERLSQEFDKFKGSFDEFRQELKTTRPLEYINKSAYFYNSEIYVDERVLIPRFETEILVEQALKIQAKDILEVGCGSGAISKALMIESKGNKNLTVSDISQDAINVSKINLKDYQVQYILSDKFKKIHQTYDLIISNPPYIKNSQKVDVHPAVVKYEPEIALFITDKEHDFWFKDFFLGAKRSLNAKGSLLMEGHEHNLDELSHLAKKLGFKNIECIKDLTGRDRVLRMRI